jgi:hypothetical protein
LMSRTVRIALALHVCVFGLALSGLSRAGEREECSTLSMHSSMVEDDHGHTVRITLQNPTQQTVEVEEFHFFSNMMNFRAIAKADGHQLRIAIPLLSPGVKPLRIRPNETVIREVSLEDMIIDLKKVLQTSDIDVSWTLTLKPNKGCFSEEVMTRITLERHP